MSRWINAFSRYGRDGIHLANAVWNHKRVDMSNQMKPILLDHARQSNAVANSLLQVDKQVGLVKYYGLSEFLRRRFQSSSTSTTSFMSTAAASGGDEKEEEKKPKAKIAFMVTASMKEELNTRLGYEPDQIKQLTPLQASLILSNDVKSDMKDDQLPALEEEYEKQAEQERQEELDRIAAAPPPPLTVAASDLSSDASSSTPDQPTSSVTGSSSTSISSDGMFSSVSKNVLNQPDISGFGEVWYEVTETNAQGETHRVGLYVDENEAMLGKEVREDINKRKNIDSTFETHQITREEL